MSQPEYRPLTEAQQARIERNRTKALLIRQAKVVHPYRKDVAVATTEASTSIIKVNGTKYIDSGGGFLLEQPVIADTASASSTSSEQTTVNDAITIPVTFEECLECGDAFAESFLFTNFGHSVCDKCRDPEKGHSLITRTEARTEYLLKDCDFDYREPALRYISRKNPHNVRWGEMKLYLLLQVEKRAMEVWGSEEELMRRHEQRKEMRQVTKLRKFNKNLKQLRMEVRSSLYTKELKGTHEHEFGPDTYNEEDDDYTHTCSTCGYSETYEKM